MDPFYVFSRGMSFSMQMPWPGYVFHDRRCMQRRSWVRFHVHRTYIVAACSVR